MAETTININLPPDAQRALKAYCDARGMKQRVVLGRLLTWFGQASEIEQHVVTGNVPAGMEGAYARALREMADRLENKAGVANHDDAGRRETAAEPRLRSAARPMGKRLGKGPNQASTQQP